MGISQYRLAKDITVAPRRINEIVHGKRSMTADTASRHSRYFGMTEQFWLNLQTHHDLEAERAVSVPAWIPRCRRCELQAEDAELSGKCVNQTDRHLVAFVQGANQDPQGVATRPPTEGGRSGGHRWREQKVRAIG
ncbi:MAG: HigA family addiction module antitoxin [Acidobacteriota bacterium]